MEINLLIGLPFQTWETANKTLEYIKELNVDRIVINPLCLTNRENLGGLESDFSKKSDLELVKIQNEIIKRIKKGF